MAHPYHHSLSSMRKWGGEVSDYLSLHSWFDLMWTGKFFHQLCLIEVNAAVDHVQPPVLRLHELEKEVPTYQSLQASFGNKTAAPHNAWKALASKWKADHE
jgi:hypothetical protein